MSSNYWEVGGFIGKDCIVRETAGGKQIATTSLSVYKAKDKNYWVQVKAFGDKVPELTKVKKGDRVVIEGRHDFEEWEKDGIKRANVGIWVDKVTVIPKPERREEESTPF